MVIIDQAPELLHILTGDTVSDKLGVAVTLSNYIRYAHKVIVMSDLSEGSVGTISSVFPEGVKRSFVELKRALSPIKTTVTRSVQCTFSRIGRDLKRQKKVDFPSKVIVFDNWRDPSVLKRAWCVWEVFGVALAEQDILGKDIEESKRLGIAMTPHQG